ncbi:MAG: DinB family protein [Terriglobia bacterium]
MTQSELNELFGYNAWANQQVIEAILKITSEQFTRNLGGSHGSIRGTLAHLAGAEQIWLERWQGKAGSKFPPEEEFDSIQRSTSRLAEIDRNLVEFMRQFPELNLEKVATYTATDGKSHSNVYRHMFSHMINHSSYHRGQLAALLRQAGAVPNSTDLIRYYRQLKPPVA